MTIEEAIEYGKEQLDIFGGIHIFGGTYREFIELSINALIAMKDVERSPQTDILNQIKAELIEKESSLDSSYMPDVALKVAYIKVLKILDKYI